MILEFDQNTNKEGTILEHRVYLWAQFWRAILTNSKGPFATWLHNSAEKAGGSVDIFGRGIGQFLEEHAQLRHRYSDQELTRKQKGLNQKWFGKQMEALEHKRSWAGHCSRCWECI